MRKKRVLKNTIIAIICFFILSIFKLIVRKLFLNTFDLELLGYEGLFTSIFTVLSIVEMGSGGMFSFMLYKAIGENNFEEQSVLMSLYKKVYTIIGIVVFLFGIVIYQFLPYIIKGNAYNWRYVYFVYIIQLLTVLITYFLAYKRTLVFANQDAYVVTSITSFYEILGCVVRCVIIFFTHNYVLYIIVPLITNFLTNYHISNYCDNNYQIEEKVKTTFDDFKNRDIIKQMQSMLFSKASTVLYTTSDSIIIPIMIGIRSMGLYSNYLQFVSIGKSLLSYFADPLGHSVGNLVYTESENKNKDLYFAIDMIGLIFGLFSLVIGVSIFQNVIFVVFGSKYLLPHGVPLMIGLDFYVRCRGFAYNAFRGTVGKYEISKKYDFLAAIINIVLSVVLGLKFGINGILFATVIGNIIIQFSRAYITFSYVIKVDVIKEILKEILFLLVSLVSLCIVLYLKRNMQYTISNVFLTICLSTLISLIIFIIVFSKNFRFTIFKQYSKEIINALINKIKK